MWHLPTTGCVHNGNIFTARLSLFGKSKEHIHVIVSLRKGAEEWWSSALSQSNPCKQGTKIKTCTVPLLTTALHHHPHRTALHPHPSPSQHSTSPSSLTLTTQYTITLTTQHITLTTQSQHLTFKEGDSLSANFPSSPRKASNTCESSSSTALRGGRDPRRTSHNGCTKSDTPQRDHTPLSPGSSPNRTAATSSASATSTDEGEHTSCHYSTTSC